jgi:hypothetical protein
MAFVLVENGKVVQKSFRLRPGFIEVADSVICGQIDSGGGVFVDPPKPPEAPQIVQDRADRQALKADAKFQNIVRKTPEQARTWTESNFPTLTPAERKDLATIVMAIGVLGRSL